MNRYLILLIAALCFQFRVLTASSASVKTERSPVKFTANKGQITDQNFSPRPDVLFYGQVNGLNYFLKRDGISYQQMEVLSWDKIDGTESTNSLNQIVVPDEARIHRIDINWLNVNQSFMLDKGEGKSGYDNFYMSHIPDGLHYVQSYESITYINIYNGIDLKWYDKNGNLEYDYIIAPFVDYQNIRWEVKGASSILVNDKGELVIKTAIGEIRERAPIAYQGGNRIKVKWQVEEDVVSFRLDQYDESRELIIDPVVYTWGTYYGGNGLDYITSQSIDDSSNVYVSGFTSSTNNIATNGAYQTTISSQQDGFLGKFDKNGQRIWGTYFGGNDDDIVYGSAVDPSQNIYIAGYTNSDIGISTPGSFKDTIDGLADAFVAKFNKDGLRLWSSYYGGPSWGEVFYDCETDNASNVYLTGIANSSTGVATTGSHQSTLSGPQDAFIVKFNGSGSRQWATYFGGNLEEERTILSIDVNGNVLIAGYTNSTNAIASSNAFQSALSGNTDGFLAKFNPSGVLAWSTYFGGINKEEIYSCATDANSNVVIVGISNSSGLATPGSYQDTVGGDKDCIVAKFRTNGQRVWSTYFGGLNVDQAFSVSIADTSHIYVSGNTFSFNAIATQDAFQTSSGGYTDGYVSKFSGSGELLWASYFGGGSTEQIRASSALNKNVLFVSGFTASTNNIGTPGTHQPQASPSLGNDGFLARIYSCDTITFSVNVVACNSYISPSGKYNWTQSGIYRDTILQINGVCDSFLTIHLTFGSNFNVVNTGSQLVVSASANATYQWVDCASSTPISGATASVFNPTINGSYAVIVKQNGCIDTSNCFNITWVGLDKYNTHIVRVYPNPTDGQLYIQFDEPASETQIVLRNNVGQRIIQRSTEIENGLVLNLSDIPTGMYFLEITSDQRCSSFKILRQ